MWQVLVGLAAGVALTLVAVGALIPRMMLQERSSPRGLTETVDAVTRAALAAGWVVQGVLPLDENVRKHGGDPGRPVRLVNLCHAGHAGEILRDDGARVVSTLMPCTIAVYEKNDGRTYVGAMNPGLLARFFGGTVARVMGGPVAAAQVEFLRAARRQGATDTRGPSPESRS